MTWRRVIDYLWPRASCSYCGEVQPRGRWVVYGDDMWAPAVVVHTYEVRGGRVMCRRCLDAQ